MGRFLLIKNFKQLQNYANRNPPWIRLYCNILNEYDFETGERKRFDMLSDHAQLCLVKLWVLGSRFSWRIPFPNEPWLRSQIRVKAPVPIDELIKSTMIELDDARQEITPSTVEQAIGQEASAPKPKRNAPFDPTEVELPVELDTPEFRAKWLEWCQYRKQSRKALSPMSVEKQIKDCAEWGEDLSIAAIDQSIRCDYQGLFAPKESKSRDDHRDEAPAMSGPITLEQAKELFGEYDD